MPSQDRPGVRAYVVLTHRDPHQVARLLDVLQVSSPGCRVLVLHDDRGGSPVRARTAVQVRRHGRAADWGSWELAEVMLDGLRWAREEARAGLVTVLSGQDYPCRPLRAWEDDLLGAGLHGQVLARPLSYRAAWGRAHGAGDDDLTRYTYRWWAVPGAGRLPGRVARLRDAALHRVEPVLDWRELPRGRGGHLGVRRRSPFDASQPCWKGSQWVALDDRALGCVLDRVDADRRVRRVYRRSVIPDESLVQTLVAWSGLAVRAAPLTHEDWSDPAEAPRTLTLDDLPRVRAARTPFCRKVDPVRSAGLMAALDRVNGATGS